MLQIISTYIGIVFMMIGVITFGIIVIDKKTEIPKYKLIIIILMVCILHTYIYLNYNGTIKTIIMCIINVLLYKNIFKIPIKKSILITIMYMLLLIIPELIQLLFVKLINMNMEYCYNSYAGSIISNIIICLLFILITYLLRKLLRKILNTEIDNNTKIVFYSTLIMICSLMFFYTIIKEFRFGENVIAYLISIIVLLIVLSSLIKQTIKNKHLLDRYDKLLEFMTSYEKEIEKNRVLRHETKNEFLSIKSRIVDKQKEEEIIKYINDIINDKHEVINEKYAKFGYLPANGIKGLCYFKTQEAEDKGIIVAINISPRVEKSIINKLNTKQNRDLGKILGVFLDNAIEGALDSKEKEFGIEVYTNMKEECEFIICNSCNKTTSINNNGTKRFSTKGKNRGHGLLLVNHIIKNNDLLSFETKIIKGLYIQTLKIKKPISK